MAKDVKGRGHVLAIRQRGRDEAKNGAVFFCPYAVVKVLAARGGAM